MEIQQYVCKMYQFSIAKYDESAFWQFGHQWPEELKSALFQPGYTFHHSHRRPSVSVRQLKRQVRLNLLLEQEPWGIGKGP